MLKILKKAKNSKPQLRIYRFL